LDEAACTAAWRPCCLAGMWVGQGSACGELKATRTISMVFADR
jgi:hypothetical protein